MAAAAVWDSLAEPGAVVGHQHSAGHPTLLTHCVCAISNHTGLKEQAFPATLDLGHLARIGWAERWENLNIQVHESVGKCAPMLPHHSPSISWQGFKVSLSAITPYR